jgi:hypothetical protein
VFPSRRGLVPAVRAFIEFMAVELSQTMQQENQALLALLAHKPARTGKPRIRRTGSA